MLHRTHDSIGSLNNQQHEVFIWLPTSPSTKTPRNFWVDARCWCSRETRTRPKPHNFSQTNGLFKMGEGEQQQQQQQQQQTGFATFSSPLAKTQHLRQGAWLNSAKPSRAASGFKSFTQRKVAKLLFLKPQRRLEELGQNGNYPPWN